MRRRRGGISPFAAGIVTLVLAALIVYFGFTKAIPFTHHYTLKAAFSSANNIEPGSPVRIAGVNVGKVTGVQLIHRQDGQTPGAIVSMRIDNQGLPIHQDATIKIRPRIFLEGNFFADVSPGSPSAPVIKDGQTIPVNQTSDPVQLDEVLAVLPTATRTDLQHLLHDLSVGLSGPGASSFNQTIPYMVPAYRFTSVVNQALLGQNEHDLSNYIASSGLVAQATDSSPAALEGLITDFNTTAGALAASDVDLERTIQAIPPTLNAARPALRALDAAFPSVRALAADLRPGVRNSLPAINAAIPLVQQLRYLVRPAELQGLIADLRQTVPSLAQLNVSSVPLLEQTREASSCQNTVVLPWSHMTLDDPKFPATGPVYQEAVKWLPGDAGESRSGDANGQWFRVLAVAPNFITPIPGTNSFQMSANPIQGSNPPKPSTYPMFRPDVPCETQQPPDLRTQSSGPPAGQRAVTPPTSNPLFQKRLSLGQSGAEKLAQHLIDANHLGNLLRVSKTPLSQSQIPALGGK